MKKLNQYISEAERAFGITKYISEAERIPCLHGYITEKFRLSKDCLKTDHYPDRKNWSITTAENGDIVEWVPAGGCLYFIYKGLNSGADKVNSASSNAIVYHATWIIDDMRNILDIAVDTGVGTLDRPKNFKLASEEMCEKFYTELKKKGYMWDENKLEIIKI